MKRFSKLKKAAAAILGAALMLTSLSVPAFATETEAPVIDTTKNGSITINKYEGEKDDTSKPLAGVEFTIYQIGTFDQKEGTSTELKIESLVTGVNEINSETKYEDIKEAVDKAITDGALEACGTGVTKLNAEKNKASVTFSNLKLGVYLVVETDAPPQVVNRSANFLVSVPMMNTDGTGWNYDIEANPKNQAVYGGITLIKKGTHNAPLQGVTFTLQRKDTTTDKWVEDTEYTTNAEGSLNVPDLAPGTYRFIETNLGDNPGYILDGKTVYEFEVDNEGKIVIGSESPTTSGVINVVNEKPDMTKQVQNREDKWGQDADYNVGDKVPYKITVDVPENITGLEMFTITDTPMNLKDDISSVKVKSGENLINNDNNSIYEVSQTQDGNGFTIEFHPAYMSGYAGTQLTIEYQAELLEGAKTTTEGNPNTAKLEYSNMIKPDQEDTDNPNKDKEPGKNTIEDNAVVYTFKINVHKQDEKKNPLQNVTFDLYKEVTKDTPEAEPGNKQNGLAQNKFWLKLKSNLKTDEQGNTFVSGLANGDYYLVETKTVNGYNLLKEPVKVTLSIQYKTSITKTWEWADDGTNGGKKLVKHTITSAETTFTGGDTTPSNAGYVTQTVINKKGFTLPATGGMGTVLFGVGGAALALAGLYMILSSRKKTSK